VLSCIAHGPDADAEGVARSAYATLRAVTDVGRSITSIS
jgi:hypothetical protein